MLRWHSVGVRRVVNPNLVVLAECQVKAAKVEAEGCERLLAGLAHAHPSWPGQRTSGITYLTKISSTIPLPGDVQTGNPGGHLLYAGWKLRN